MKQKPGLEAWENSRVRKGERKTEEKVTQPRNMLGKICRKGRRRGRKIDRHAILDLEKL